MRKEVIYQIPSLYRGDFLVKGYYFGRGKKSLCIVGSMRGNEYQQIYICSQLIKRLKELEAADALDPEQEILVIPSLNPCSMNIGTRFWPTDNTDINRMFPGYNLGETTQRIADGIFKTISQYENGIQLASFYMPGRFSPHVRLMKTGMEDVDGAKDFGLPYVVLKIPKPYDTTTLNYNWQIWKTNAFSLYSSTTATLDEDSKEQMIEAILSFMKKRSMVTCELEHEKRSVPSHTFQDRELISLRPQTSGIFKSMTDVNENVEKGQIIGRVLDPCEGGILETLCAPVDGTVFFLHDEPLVYANTAAIKLLP